VTTFSGSKSYIVPAFSTIPTGFEAAIIYSDVSTSPPAFVIFNPQTREYDWSLATQQVDAFTLTMQGLYPGGMT
jgi:hypothetical protein